MHTQTHRLAWKAEHRDPVCSEITWYKIGLERSWGAHRVYLPASEEGLGPICWNHCDVHLCILFLRVSGDGNTRSITGNLFPTYSRASITLWAESSESLHPPCCSASHHVGTADVLLSYHLCPTLVWQALRVLSWIRTPQELHHLTPTAAPAAARSTHLPFAAWHDFRSRNPHWFLLTTVLLLSVCKAWTFVAVFFWKWKSGCLLCPAWIIFFSSFFSSLLLLFLWHHSAECLQSSKASHMFLFLQGLTLKRDNKNQVNQKKTALKIPVAAHSFSTKQAFPEADACKHPFERAHYASHLHGYQNYMKLQDSTSLTYHLLMR